MRMLFPGVKVRREVKRRLEAFFDAYQNADFDVAIQMWCAFYKLPAPKILWFEYLGHGKLLGETMEDGEVRLIHPENWKQMKAKPTFKPTRAQWVNTTLHELAHYMYFCDDERKANLYAAKFVKGIA
jgi:hypothetical protein